MSTDGTSQDRVVCANHPEAAAPYVCQRCQRAVCYECCYSLADGSVCCKTCFQSIAEPPVPAPSAVARPRVVVRSSPTVTATASAFPVTQGRGTCVQHPSVLSIARCKRCGAGSCATCDFVFPGNLHYCPVCATKAGRELSPRRKQYLTAAYCLAGASTLTLVLLIGLAAGGMLDDESGGSIWGMLFILFFGVPATIGTGMGLSAWRPGANPVSVWIALVWNALMQGGMLLLMIIGIFSS